MNSYFVKAMRVATAFLVLFSLVLSLCACFRSLRIRKKQEERPLNKFPDTTWVCRELDLKVDMIADCGIYGTYTTNEKEYRVLLDFWGPSEMVFNFYLSTENSVSEYDPSLVHCSRVKAGKIDTDYFYDKDSGLIVCSVRSHTLGNEPIPETLTFEQVGPFSPSPSIRWVAEELDLYLDSFSDAKGYFKGEIAIDGKRRKVQAIEIGNDKYYKLWIGRVLAYLMFEISEDQIIATVTDEYRYDDYEFSIQFPDWYDNYKDVKTITFRPTPIE